MSICDLCQLSSPAIGCTRLSGEDCLKDALKLIKASATNGDVINALFPNNGSYGTNGNEVHVFGIGGNGILVFTKDWWNRPYKAGDTDG